MLLESPIIASLKVKVESLKEKLNQILLLSELWLEVQHKVNKINIEYQYDVVIHREAFEIII